MMKFQGEEQDVFFAGPTGQTGNEDSILPGGHPEDRSRITRCLLPVLHCVAGLTAAETDDEEKKRIADKAKQDISREIDLYRGLARTWQEGSVEERQNAFGFLACNQSLLADAFSFISRQLALREGDNTRQNDSAQNAYTAGNGRELLFISLFRITDEGESVDLSYPFEQFYFCDHILYKDYLYRRTELAEKCRAWIRHYRPYYIRIENAFRDESRNPAFALPAEYVSYMELIDYFTKQVLYEDGLQGKRETLAYERGGLGWFHFSRKKEIAKELRALDIEELKLRLDTVREKCEAYADQFREEREQWIRELADAPRTAFARKKELKDKIADVEKKLDSFCKAQKMEELESEYKRMKKY